MEPWYEKLFSNYGEKYEEEPFVHGTKGEVDFIEKEIHYDRSKKILDVGCGTGRHTIELTERGYRVTGVDLSESMLDRARKKAAEKQLDIPFMQRDARSLGINQEYDAVIMLCEGAFPLMETDEMNYRILLEVYRALASNGQLIMTTLNALYPLTHGKRNETNKMIVDTGEHSQFHLATFREQSLIRVIDNDGAALQVQSSERYYTPAEMRWLLHSAGFRTVDIFGCTLGAFSRHEQLSPDHFEMLISASV